ncbi:unnamed protein product, partial [Candidula unifasciata]
MCLCGYLILADTANTLSEFAQTVEVYVDNVHRPGYILHLVHHSNYWGNYEPMDGGESS